MKKIFTFIAAALMSVSMFGKTVTEDITMDPANWTWGYGSAVVADGDMLKCILTSEWGAMAIGWNEPIRDLSEWDKIVIVVENMNGCDGEWFKLKAYLRDYVNKDSEQGQMETTLGLDAEDNQQHYMVINLKEEGKNVNLTACGVLGIQCQPNGAEFKISRVYLEKEGEPLPTIPEVAPTTPDIDEANALGIYCKHYTVNNANFGISGWAQGYETLDLDGTDVAYWAGFTWECIIDPAHTDDPHDFSAFEMIHFDMWAPTTASIQFAAEAVAGGNYKDGPIVNLVQGWNYFDVALADWPENYDFKNVKCFVLQQYKTPEGASFEGNPFAIANIYFWKKATAVENASVEAKAVKVVRDGQVMIIKNGKAYNALGAEMK